MKSKKKYNLCLYILCCLFLLMVGFTTYFYQKNNIVYSNEVVTMMQKEDILDIIDKKNYSKTLEVALSSDNFIKQYTNEYEKIDYVEKDNFILEINKLLNLNYNANEINGIFKNLSSINLEKLLKENKKLDLTKYYNFSNFEVDKIDRYEAYYAICNCSLKDIIVKVNIGLDQNFYTNIQDTLVNDDYTTLVNKYHSIGKYEPDDLVPLGEWSNYKLREKAAEAFLKLVAAAKLDGVSIVPYSAYRSYETQDIIYNRYVSQDGKEEADTYSARPGHSEHQLGLAVDVWSYGYNEIKEEDAKWLSDNSYKYGFIIRYTKENKPITGYIEEPWHLRYLGDDIATDVYKSGLTYDEYYDLYIKEN